MWILAGLVAAMIAVWRRFRREASKPGLTARDQQPTSHRR
jgi:hypothetical protein